MAVWQTELRQTVIDVTASRNDMAYHHYAVLEDGDSPSYFVKYSSESLLEESRTLQYLYNLAQFDPRAPRIPKIYDFFTTFDILRREYLVMEYIPPPTVTIGKWIADVISWLHACPLPLNASIGPVGGGIIRHRFFRDGDAPIEFASVAALEIYINKALSIAARVTPKEPLLTISFTDVPLQFYHGDVTYENFLIDPDTLDIWLIDAEDIGILPAPFSTFALNGSEDPLLRAVSSNVDIFRWDQMKILYRAVYWIHMFSNGPFGLDSYGRETPKKIDDNVSYQDWKLEPLPPPPTLPSKYDDLQILEVPVLPRRWDTWKFLPSV
ncbi:hypothetical protein J132_00933 [Termitomyces sp. J132]|nr:hypothetical protein J132_00933 [Termitomyces sp. J132]